MIFLKKYLKISLVPIISILFLSIIFSILNLFYIDIPKLIYLLSMIAIMMFTGYQIGINTQKKAYRQGLLSSFVIVIILLILTLIFNTKITINNIIYYFIIMFTTTLGSIIGINKKRK